MTLLSMTAESLTIDLGETVEDVMVIIGKHEVQGFDSKGISELLGITADEVDEVRETQLYKNMLLLMKVEHSKSRTQVDLSWDGIEEVALNRLFERVKVERDGDFLLKVAAVANKATRRIDTNKVLDPSQAGARVPLTLTRRTVERFSGDGSREVSVEDTMRINDGRMVNPSFGDVDALLSVSQKPFTDKSIEAKLVMHDPNPEEMLKEIQDSESW